MPGWPGTVSAIDDAPRLMVSLIDVSEIWPDLRATAVVGLDLSDARLDWSVGRFDGATFLGCTFPAGVLDRLGDSGAATFSSLRDVPLQPYRTHLYSYDELTTV